MKDNKQERALAVFLKNQRLGKVKTRLAASLGDQKALDIYTKLTKLTLNAAKEAASDVHLFYDETIETYTTDFKANLHLQEGDGLGERMQSAFGLLLKKYQKVVLIGSDLPEISAGLIDTAFEELNHCDVVIGPALDGGYYLIGLKSLQPALFNAMTYSHSEVYRLTLNRAKGEKLKVNTLKTLRDLDTVDDLSYFDFLNS